MTGLEIIYMGYVAAFVSMNYELTLLYRTSKRMEKAFKRLGRDMDKLGETYDKLGEAYSAVKVITEGVSERKVS